VRYLTAAEQTGNWLLATAERSPQGWFWPVQPGVSAEVIPGLGWGTAAPTVFFVEAFRTTGDERWLSAARAGARWMDAHLDESAGRWAGCGLLTGIGGWAVVLDELAAAARDEQARDLARRVLETVAANASADGDAVHWHDLTEMVWGTAGIGCLMLTLGADYLGPAAVDLAVRAGDWLLAQAEAAPTGIRWSLGRAYEAERPDDQRRFPNFAHGAAGIGFFLARLG
jgi:lantibiotic modifying enzyme